MEGKPCSRAAAPSAGHRSSINERAAVCAHRPSALSGRMPRPYAAMLGRAETSSYQRLNAVSSSGIASPTALVAKSTVTMPVMSATENSSPAMKGTSVSRALKSA